MRSPSHQCARAYQRGAPAEFARAALEAELHAPRHLVIDRARETAEDVGFHRELVAQIDERHARLARDCEARNSPLALDTRVHAARGVTEITIFAGDHAGLFAAVAGAIDAGAIALLAVNSSSRDSSCNT